MYVSRIYCSQEDREAIHSKEHARSRDEGRFREVGVRSTDDDDNDNNDNNDNVDDYVKNTTSYKLLISFILGKIVRQN